MTLPDRHVRFGWQTLALFATAAVTVALLEIAEQQDLIGKRTEGVARFVVFLPLLSVFVALSRKPYFSASVKCAVLVCAFAAGTEMFLGVTEDIPSLDNVAIVGGNSRVRVVLEKALMGIWICSTFSLLYLLLKSVESVYGQIVQRERLSALGEMSHALAHDLNNTLSPVVGYAQLLDRVSELAPEHREWVAAIAQNASDAAAVVQSLQRFTGQRDEATMECMDLREVVQQIPNLTRPKWKDEPQKTGREIDFQLQLTEEPAPIRGNPVELRQMLVNLVFNAVDAMPEGGTITIGLRSTDESVAMHVTDTGRGMTDEEQRRCLEPYYSNRPNGSGLGLSVCYGIVQKHNGNIRLSSRSGAGTTFDISFPRMLEPEEPQREVPPPTASPAEKHILYIDDDEQVRDATKWMLQVLGHRVDLAEDGPSGLSKFREGGYDLVITDLGMARMDGSEVVRAIKETDPTFPVALITGWPASDVAKRFSDTVRPDWIIEKPATLEDFQTALLSSESG